MVGIGRIYVVVVIRIVVCEGHFRTYVNVLCRQSTTRKGSSFFRSQSLFRKDFGQRIQRHTQLRLVFGLFAKRFVRVVQARIQDCYNHAFACIFVSEFGRIVNTRLINGGFVGRSRTSRRRTRCRIANHRLGLAVRLGKHYAFNSGHFLDGRNVTGVDTDCHCVIHRRVSMYQRITNILRGKSGQERILSCLDILFRLLAVLGQQVAIHFGIACSFQQTVALEADDYGMFRMAFRRRSSFRIFQHRSVKVLLYDIAGVELTRNVFVTDVPAGCGRNRCCSAATVCLRTDDAFNP